MFDREDIRDTFLSSTIADFLDPEFEMAYIKFVFDQDTLASFEQYLNKNDKASYDKGLKSIEYLSQIRQQWLNGEDDIFIVVHDSSKFFELLDKIIDKIGMFPKKLHNYKSFIRSMWIRMGAADIQNVEFFLKKQLVFLNSALPEGVEQLDRFNDLELLICEIDRNSDWFETNQNIRFSIHRDDEVFDRNTKDNFIDYYIDEYQSYSYDFPSVHFALGRTRGKNTCFIYGIQKLSQFNQKDEEIKKKLQPLRKKFRNPYVSADFMIALGLCLDYFYNCGIKDFEIVSLQVFSYPYHEQLSSFLHDELLSKYSEDERTWYEELYRNGYDSGRAFIYMREKSAHDIFYDKQDLISKNKTERFLHTALELVEHYPSIEVVSEAFVQSENMILHLNGPVSILSDIYPEKDSSVQKKKKL